MGSAKKTLRTVACDSARYSELGVFPAMFCFRACSPRGSLAKVVGRIGLGYVFNHECTVHGMTSLIREESRRERKSRSTFECAIIHGIGPSLLNYHLLMITGKEGAVAFTLLEDHVHCNHYCEAYAATTTIFWTVDAVRHNRDALYHSAHAVSPSGFYCCPKTDRAAPSIAHPWPGIFNLQSSCSPLGILPQTSGQW